MPSSVIPQVATQTAKSGSGLIRGLFFYIFTKWKVSIIILVSALIILHATFGSIQAYKDTGSFKEASKPFLTEIGKRLLSADSVNYELLKEYEKNEYKIKVQYDETSLFDWFYKFTGASKFYLKLISNWIIMWGMLMIWYIIMSKRNTSEVAKNFIFALLIFLVISSAYGIVEFFVEGTYQELSYPDNIKEFGWYIMPFKSIVKGIQLAPQIINPIYENYIEPT